MATNVKRLFKDFKPEHYDLHLSVFPDKLHFEGKVVIRGQKTGRPSRRLTFHQKGLKIKGAKVTFIDKRGNKSPFPIARINNQKSLNEVRLHSQQMAYPGRYEIEITFESSITRQMDGIYPCYFKIGKTKKMLLATQFESHHAREAFPCIDEPEAKATFQLTLETDSGLTSVSNTSPLTEVVEGNRTTTVFGQTPRMSTYLLAFVSGDLSYSEATTKHGVAVRAYSTPDNIKHTSFALETAVKCLDFFNDYFGIAYPLDKCDIIALPDFASGAMENWGCITFREQAMLVDERHTSLSSKQFVALVVAHELAHQWFGNLVTMRWWTDLWLNEGFASWIEYLACDHLYPEWQLWTQFLVDEREPALKLDALKSTHPIEVPVHHPDEIRTIFDAISYNKGASVINMLHNYLGPEDFKTGLRHYLKKHAYDNTDTVDLWSALEEVSNKPVKKFMHAWTSLPGFPVVQVDRGLKGDTLVQSHFLISPHHKSSSHNWPIPLLTNVASDPPLLERHTAKLKPSKKTRILNKDQTGFYRTAYDADAVVELGKLVAAGKLSVTDRIGLLSDSFETAKAGANSTVNALRLLESYANEDSSPVWDVMAGNLAALRAVMDNEELREAMKPYSINLVANQYKRLGWQKKSKEPYFDQLLRPTILALLAVSDDPATIKHAQKLFKNMHSPDDIPAEEREAGLPGTVKGSTDIDPDLRGIVYGAVVRHGGQAEFDKLLKMHNQSTNSEERNTIAAALTGFKDPKLVKEALSLITTDVVRLQDVMYWVAYSFMNRFARRQTWDWVQENWSWLAKNFEGDLGFYRLPIYAGRAFSDDNFIKEFKEFFVPKRTPAFARSIDQAIETINWHASWRKRDLDPVLDYFTNL